MIKRHYCTLLFLLIFAGNTSAQEEKPFPELGDASPDDCVASFLVYDKVFSAPPNAQDFEGATAFLNDVCNLDESIRIVADGEQQVLRFVDGKTKKGFSGTKSHYANHAFSVFLEIGQPLYSINYPESECVETSYFVRTTISYAGRQKVIEGTSVGGCP